MVGLLVMAGVGLATRLDRSDDRIEMGTAPAADAGESTGDSTKASRPAETLGTNHDELGTTPAAGEPAPATSGTIVPRPQGTVFDPSAYGPQGTAEVTLACGDTADTRTVTAFRAEPTSPGTTALYWSEPAGRGHQLQVGDQFPAGSRLSWSIIGVQLGPWTPDRVTDTCTTPVPAPTAPSHYTVPPTSATAPVPGYNQAWTARATLACGDTADTRRVTSFDATTNGAGTANLMEWDPATGRIRQLAVGDQFPVTHTLSWAIQGVFLGPWPVPQVTDGC